MSRIIASVESDAINHPSVDISDFKILLESLKSSLGLGLTSDDTIIETLGWILAENCTQGCPC